MGNPSPPPSRFPSTLEISLGLRPREISRVSGNLLGVGDGFPNTSLVLVEHGYNLSYVCPVFTTGHLFPVGLLHDTQWCWALEASWSEVPPPGLLQPKPPLQPHCQVTKMNIHIKDKLIAFYWPPPFVWIVIKSKKPCATSCVNLWL